MIAIPRSVSKTSAAYSSRTVCSGVLSSSFAKKSLIFFHNGLLFFLGQVGIFRQPLGELLAALLRAGLTTEEVKDHLADGIFSALKPLYSLAAAAVNARRKRIRHLYQIADNK